MPESWSSFKGRCSLEACFLKVCFLRCFSLRSFFPRVRARACARACVRVRAAGRITRAWVMQAWDAAASQIEGRIKGRAKPPSARSGRFSLRPKVHPLAHPAARSCGLLQPPRATCRLDCWHRWLDPGQLGPLGPQPASASTSAAAPHGPAAAFAFAVA